MTSTCKKCKGSYYFDDSKISDEGINYRCPRCGSTVVFRKNTPAIDIPSKTSPSAGEGTNPVVHGAYSGALAGLGCAIPSVLMTALGLSFMSLGMQVTGYTAASAVMLALLKMLSLGILIGMSLAFIGSKTELDVWSIQGGLIGTGIGGLVGILSGVFIGMFTGGILGSVVIFFSALGSLINSALVSAAVILARRFVFSREDGMPGAPLSGRQAAFVGVLFFLMVFTIGMEVKGHLHAKAAYNQAMKEMSAEGLVVKDKTDSSNEDGDLVISGSIQNTTGSDKTGWIMVAEMLDGSGSVIKKATVLNGIQIYGIKDIEALKKRGKEVPRPTPAERSDKMVVKPGDSLPFKIIFVDPPKEYKEYTLTLKDVDQDSVKELFTETFKDIQDFKKPGQQ